MNNFSNGRAEKALSDIQKEDKNQLVISYLNLRNLIGFCGIFLPILLVIVWHNNECYHNFEPSISDYYYTSGGDIFVVILSALGLFLYTYNGYDRFEKLLLNIAATCALLVALVPTNPKCLEKGDPCVAGCGLPIHNINYRGFLGYFINEHWHLVFAAIFLLCLALISLIYFTKTPDPIMLRINGKLTQKGKRNIVYKICGWTIIASLVVLGIVLFIESKNNIMIFPGFPIIFVFETISVWAFGLSWITKGETLWPDRKQQPKQF